MGAPSCTKSFCMSTTIMAVFSGMMGYFTCMASPPWA
jgi:hypothetical protein